MATRKKKSNTVEIEPSTVVGTHLTVITDNFGKTTLIWDDEQLLKEVREAIASVESKPKKKEKILNSVEVAEKAVKKAKESSKKEVAKKPVAKIVTKKKTVAKKKTK